MSDIAISAGVRQNLLSLQSTADMMSETQNRLATGKKVNSALDNPSNFFTSSSLNSRASDMNALMDGMANGIKTLEAADNGLSAITKTLESMQSTLRQARQDKSFETKSFSMGDIDANATDLGKLELSGGAVGNPTEIALTKTGSGAEIEQTAAYEAPATAGQASLAGGVTVVDGDTTGGLSFDINFGGKTASVSLAADAGNTVADLKTAIEDALSGSELAGVVEVSESSGDFTLTSAENVDGEITVSGTNADDVFGTAPADPDSVQAGEFTSTVGSDGQHSFSINGKDVTLDGTSGADLETAVSSINTALGDDSKFEAYEAAGGKIGLRATADDAGSLQIKGDDADLFGSPTNGVVTATTADDLTFARDVDEMVSAVNTALEGKVRASNDNGKLRIENLSTQELTVGGIDSEGTTLDGTDNEATIGGNSVRADLANQYNELRDQLDKLADDASFNGVNLLRGDNLQITFNETGTSELNIQTEGGETVNSANLGIQTELSAKQLDSDDSIDGFLSEVKTAINDVRAQSSSFGSSLSIVENRSAFTTNMVNTLQTGADNLTLADSNEEAANLLALQTRQQLSSTALSMASQQDQAVLRLF